MGFGSTQQSASVITGAGHHDLDGRGHLDSGGSGDTLRWLAPVPVPATVAYPPLGADSAPAPDSAGSLAAGHSAGTTQAEAIIALIASYSWPTDWALAVAQCESGLRPEAISPDGSNRGLMQVNIVHIPRIEAMGYTWDQMLEARPNLDVANAIWLEQGAKPWTCG